MKDIKHLANDLKLFEKEIRKQANETAKEATVQTIGLLATHTRVDTSKALSNWRASVGFPKTAEIEPYYEGEQGSTREASIAATIENAIESVKNKRPGQNCFITNNVDYMDYLTSSSYYNQPDWIEAVGNISERNWKFKYPTRIG